jgi:hypothetical protein
LAEKITKNLQHSFLNSDVAQPMKARKKTQAKREKVKLNFEQLKPNLRLIGKFDVYVPPEDLLQNDFIMR